jgi:hypothetical protein
VTGFILRQLGALATIALVVFALLAQRTIERGEREMSESDRAFDAGQLELAVLHARRAATAYVPGARHVAAGYARLRAVARGAERERDVKLALGAWGAVRAAAIESRHLWQPHAAALDEADAQLARLSNGSPAAPPARHDGLPLAVLAGLVCGAAAALLGWGAWRGDDAPSGQQRPRLRLAALACLGGVIVWGVALLSA